MKGEEEERSRRPNMYTENDASLIGALLGYNGTNDVGALLFTWHEHRI
jgi:hypothetical protein